MSGENISNIDIIINILAQVFNIWVFLFVFKYFLADKVVELIENRKKLLAKIQNAEEKYNQIISEAEEEKNKIIKDALKHKEKILEEAKVLASQEKERILNKAHQQAEEIIENAKAYWEKLKKQLEESWEYSLKHTTKLVVLKLFGKDTELKEKYLNEVIKEFSK